MLAHARGLLPAAIPDILSAVTFGRVIDVVDESGGVLSVLRELLDLVRDYDLGAQPGLSVDARDPSGGPSRLRATRPKHCSQQSGDAVARNGV